MKGTHKHEVQISSSLIAAEIVYFWSTLPHIYNNDFNMEKHAYFWNLFNLQKLTVKSTCVHYLRRESDFPLCSPSKKIVDKP